VLSGEQRVTNERICTSIGWLASMVARIRADAAAASAEQQAQAN
jgi:hypothetical protein